MINRSIPVFFWEISNVFVDTYLYKLWVEESREVYVVSELDAVAHQPLYLVTLDLWERPAGGQMVLTPLPQQLIERVPGGVMVASAGLLYHMLGLSPALLNEFTETLVLQCMCGE